MQNVAAVDQTCHAIRSCSGPDLLKAYLSMRIGVNIPSGTASAWLTAQSDTAQCSAVPKILSTLNQG